MRQAQTIAPATRRTMDCIDCHNTVGHPFSPTAGAGRGSRDRGRPDRAAQLPFVRREGVRLVKAEYPSEEAAARGDRTRAAEFLRVQARLDRSARAARTVTAVQDVYRRNVFPTMKVTWGTYPDNRGHMTSTGCFRCHDDSHTAKDGTNISADCEYCHKQIETPESYGTRTAACLSLRPRAVDLQDGGLRLVL